MHFSAKGVNVFGNGFNFNKKTHLIGLKLIFLNPFLFLLTLLAAKLVAVAMRFSRLSNTLHAPLSTSSVTSHT
jgi:hypothetical protein